MISTILIADKHELFRKCLINTLIDSFPRTNFLESASGIDLLSKAKEEQPDVIISGIKLNELNGIKTLIRLKEMGLSSKIIMLTSQTAKEFIFIAKEYGANGYITKNISPESLKEVILRVYTSNLFICSEWFSLDFHNSNQFIKRVLPVLNTLTKREREVLTHFFEGLNTNEVATQMNIQQKSINNYKNRILSKMGNESNIYFNDWVNKNRNVLKYLI